MTFNDKYRIFYVFILLSVPLSIAVAAETSWWYLACSLIWFRFMSSMWVQIGMHRYFTHRNFKTGPWRHKFLAIGSLLTGNGSIITWAAHHTHHHIHSDLPGDLHSPRDGWWHTAFSWAIAGTDYFMKEKKVAIPKHLLRDKLVIWLHNNYFIMWTIGVTALCLIDWKLALFGLIAPAGWSVLFGNIITNLFSHLKLPGSYQNYFTSDNSQNNVFVQILNLGEGLHNNHHYDASKYNQAMAPGEFDPVGWFVKKFFDINATS